MSYILVALKYKIPSHDTDSYGVARYFTETRLPGIVYFLQGGGAMPLIAMQCADNRYHSYCYGPWVHNNKSR